MACANCYATTDELKTRLDVLGTDDDAMLEDIIEAASRQIDGWCGRSFYADAAATRYYTADSIDVLVLHDDLVSITTLKTDEDADRVYETTWAATDYDLEPLTGPPYTRIHLAPMGRYGFPTHRRAIEIVGTFGYSDVPHAIREACLLQAGRLYKRKDAPFGIAGSQDAGQLQTIGGMDPDVKQMVQHYRKPLAVGV